MTPFLRGRDHYDVSSNMGGHHFQLPFVKTSGSQVLGDAVFTVAACSTSGFSREFRIFVGSYMSAEQILGFVKTLGPMG